MIIYHVKCIGDQTIGGTITAKLNELQAERIVKIIAVIPSMMSFYGRMPDRYQITEADIIIK